MNVSCHGLPNDPHSMLQAVNAVAWCGHRGPLLLTSVSCSLSGRQWVPFPGAKGQWSKNPWAPHSPNFVEDIQFPGRQSPYLKTATTISIVTSHSQKYLHKILKIAPCP